MNPRDFRRLLPLGHLDIILNRSGSASTKKSRVHGVGKRQVFLQRTCAGSDEAGAATAADGAANKTEIGRSGRCGGVVGVIFANIIGGSVITWGEVSLTMMGRMGRTPSILQPTDTGDPYHEKKWLQDNEKRWKRSNIYVARGEDEDILHTTYGCGVSPGNTGYLSAVRLRQLTDRRTVDNL